MKVLLLKNVEDLGHQGEIKEVSAGYARNFLIPRGLADIATTELITALEQHKLQEAKRAESDLHRAEKLAMQLDGQEFEVSAKASDAGTLYAALTPAKIASILKTKNYIIPKEQIKTESIKAIGEYKITIQLAHKLEATIILVVSPVNKK